MAYGSWEEKQSLGTRSSQCLILAILLSATLLILAVTLFDSVGRSTPSVRFFLPVGMLITDVTLWILGCGFYAKSKGYPAAFGIAGIGGVVGLCLLWPLPDRWERELRRLPKTSPVTDLTNYPR